MEKKKGSWEGFCHVLLLFLSNGPFERLSCRQRALLILIIVPSFPITPFAPLDIARGIHREKRGQKFKMATITMQSKLHPHVMDVIRGGATVTWFWQPY